MTTIERPHSSGIRSLRLGTIIGYTLRSCLPPKRVVAVLLTGVGVVVFGLLGRAVSAPTAEEAFSHAAADGILSLMMPIAALVIGDAILGAELRAGTFAFTWLSPTPPWQIVLGRWAAGVAVGLVVMVPAAVLAAVLAGASSAAIPLAAAVASGLASYVALFVLVGCITKRTAVWSLAIVFLVERLLGTALTGVAQLSPQWEARAVMVGLMDHPARRLLRDGIPEGGAAVARLALIAVVSLVLASWRLRHIELSGPSD